MKLSPMHRTTKRAPLITFKDLAAEFGVTMAVLRGYMSGNGAPQPAMKTLRACYYEATSFRKWWAGVVR